MKMLYRCFTGLYPTRYYWGTDNNEVLELYRNGEGIDEEIPVFAERVWADNKDLRLKGYVCQED